MEMCVAITEMEGAFGFEVGCAIIPVIPSLKCIYHENQIFVIILGKNFKLCCVLFIANCGLHVDHLTLVLLDICYVPVYC